MCLAKLNPTRYMLSPRYQTTSRLDNQIADFCLGEFRAYQEWITHNHISSQLKLLEQTLSLLCEGSCQSAPIEKLIPFIINVANLFIHKANAQMTQADDGPKLVLIFNFIETTLKHIQKLLDIGSLKHKFAAMQESPLALDELLKNLYRTINRINNSTEDVEGELPCSACMLQTTYLEKILRSAENFKQIPYQGIAGIIGAMGSLAESLNLSGNKVHINLPDKKQRKILAADDCALCFRVRSISRKKIA